MKIKNPRNSKHSGHHTEPFRIERYVDGEIIYFLVKGKT